MDRICRGIQTTLHLRPRHGHGYRRVRPGAGRERGHGRRELVVPKVVEKDLARPLRLAHVDEIAVWTIAGHLAADVPGELLRFGPGQPLSFFRAREWCHDMQTFATRGLAEGDEAEVG